MSFFGSMIGLSGATGVVSGAMDAGRTLNTAKNLYEETESANSNATMTSEAKMGTDETTAVSSMGANEVKAGGRQTEIWSNAVL